MSVKINFDNSYARLPEIFYQNILPQAVKNPELALLNQPLCRRLGWRVVEEHHANRFLSLIFSGNHIPCGAAPIAMAYAGHQYGHFVPLLGDGRAHLIGEIINPFGRRYDVSLKGSGKTRFSRGGDGRAPLGPMLREYIISTFMQAMGVPSTESLAVVTTGENVQRDQILPGGILTRIAQSHLRVGTFEFAAQHQQQSIIAGYAIARHYPECVHADNPYLEFLQQVVERQAWLLAQWMSLGFVHGVMNSDNMSIAGEGIDYGPCAFMEQYDVKTVFSSIDKYGRYAYGNQPNIAQWNLALLGVSLLPLLHGDKKTASDKILAIIESFQSRYRNYYTQIMLQKCGLSQSLANSDKFIDQLLQQLQYSRIDYTQFFAKLTDYYPNKNIQDFAEKQQLPHSFYQWLSRWCDIVQKSITDTASQHKDMKRMNPQFIPRNHRVEQAIAAVVDRGDMKVITDLLQVLQQPCEDHPEFDYLRAPATAKEQVKQTFCGT